MKPRWLYRIAAVLLILFAVGHTLGFRQTESSWGVDNLLSTMRSLHFTAQGFHRTYYDFYVGFGLFVSVLLFFAAIVAWQLSSLPQAMLTLLPVVRWGLVVCFVVVTFLSWRYFFLIPIIFSGAITVCLGLAAWLSRK